MVADAATELANCMVASGTIDVDEVLSCSRLLAHIPDRVEEFPFSIQFVFSFLQNIQIPTIGNLTIGDFNTICNTPNEENFCWQPWSAIYLSFPQTDALLDSLLTRCNREHSGNDQLFRKAVLYKCKMLNGALFDSISDNKSDYLNAINDYSQIDTGYLNQRMNTPSKHFPNRGEVFRFPFIIGLNDPDPQGFVAIIGSQFMANPVGFLNMELTSPIQRPFCREKEVNEYLLIVGTTLLTNLGNCKNPNFDPNMFINPMFGCSDSTAFAAFLGQYFYGIHDSLMTKTFMDHVTLGEMASNLTVSGSGTHTYINRHFFVPLFDRAAFLKARLSAADSVGLGIFDLNYLAKVAYALPEDYQKRDFLLTCIDTFLNARQELAAIEFLDKLLTNFPNSSSLFGNKVFELLGRSATAGSLKIALQFIRAKDDKDKCFFYLTKGLCESGRYHDAYSLIPNYSSANSQLWLYNVMLSAFKTKTLSGTFDGWSFIGNNKKNLATDDRDTKNDPYERTTLYNVHESTED